MYKKLFILFLLFFFAQNAEAAELYFTISDSELSIGSEFNIGVNLNSEEVSINAAQAEINFPNNLYEIIEIDRKTSIFNFWIVEPSFSNDTGIISFIGGTAKGVSGESLNIFKINARVTGVGSGDQTFTDAVVTASDGKGTNILSSIKDLEISIGTKTVVIKKSVSVEEPVKVEKPRIEAVGLPDRPEVSIALYPDDSRWYSHTSEVIALWEVPDDVTKVALLLDHSPNTVPPEAEEELFNGKSFGVLEEGIWYIHVQFRNNIGWGPVDHYKISLDTTAPLPFEIKTGSDITDNPIPQIRFETQDSLSGVSSIVILIDEKISNISTETPIILPILSPGDHVVTVRVFDQAGNSVEDDLTLKILPLSTPIINFVTTTVSENELIFISGQSIEGDYVDINLCDKNCKEVFEKSIELGDSGNWELFISETLSTGLYTLTAKTRDERGATSYKTEDVLIKVKAVPVLSLGFVDLGWFELFLLLIVVVLAATSVVAWNYIEEQKKRGAYAVITSRDVKKFGELLDNDIVEIERRLHNIEPEIQGEIRTIIEKMKNTVTTLKKHIAKEVERLK